MLDSSQWATFVQCFTSEQASSWYYSFACCANFIIACIVPVNLLCWVCHGPPAQCKLFGFNPENCSQWICRRKGQRYGLITAFLFYFSNFCFLKKKCVMQLMSTCYHLVWRNSLCNQVRLARLRNLVQTVLQKPRFFLKLNMPEVSW